MFSENFKKRNCRTGLVCKANLFMDDNCDYVGEARCLDRDVYGNKCPKICDWAPGKWSWKADLYSGTSIPDTIYQEKTSRICVTDFGDSIDSSCCDRESSFTTVRWLQPFHNMKTWHQATNYCESLGGVLWGDLFGLEEQLKWLADLFGSDVAIGIEYKGGKWVNLLGEDKTGLIMWQEGEPNNIGSNSFVYLWAQTKRFSDGPSTSQSNGNYKWSYVCQYKQLP